MEDSNYVKIKSVNSLCLIINKVDGNVEELNRNKYLTLVSIDKSKEVLTKYTELWDEIENSIEKRNINQVNMEKISRKSNSIHTIVCL